jgi:hypothetical protein
MYALEFCDNTVSEQMKRLYFTASNQVFVFQKELSTLLNAPKAVITDTSRLFQFSSAGAGASAARRWPRGAVCMTRATENSRARRGRDGTQAAQSTGFQ